MTTTHPKRGICITASESGVACITLISPAHMHTCGCGSFYVCAERDCNAGPWDCPTCSDDRMAEWLEVEAAMQQLKADDQLWGV